MSEPEPNVPSVADDPRERPGDVAEPPGKVWFRRLDEAVIEADRCIQCGTCVAACPSDSIGIDEAEGRPTLVKMCTGCSSCWDYCPRSGLRYERIVADSANKADPETKGILAARAPEASRHKGQDGGVVTELLARLLENDVIDGAIVATEHDDTFRGVATLATSRAELQTSAGSIYDQVMSLGRVEELIDERGLEEPDLALVGTPCVIQGARALERYDHDGASPIALSVALMCTRTFEHERLAAAIGERGVDVDAVDRLDVSDGMLTVYDADRTTLMQAPVDEFDSAGLRGCAECTDFVGGAADISAGSVGSGDGWTTIAIRSERGRKAWEVGGDTLTVSPITDTDPIDDLAAWNERRARAVLPREFDPKGTVGISPESHRDAYEGTDREPRPLNPARVYQYEEWC